MDASVDIVKTVPSTDMGFGLTSQTVFLMHADGVQGSTTFVDATGRHRIESTDALGHPPIIDTTQFVFGGASCLINGVGADDRLTIQDNIDDFAFGLGDWTIDFWMRAEAVGTGQTLFDGRPYGSPGGQYPTILLNNDGTIRYIANAVALILSAGLVVNNVWTHLAFTRASNVLRFFQDGIDQTAGGVSDTVPYISDVGDRPLIGCNGVNPDVLSYQGWKDEFRIVKGRAVWTSNFTPPTCAYTAI